MKFLTVPTYWQWHVPVLWWTPSVHRWRHVCNAASFPSKQTSPSPHLLIFLTQILLKPPIYTIHHPYPFVMANPMALVPASFPPCFLHLHKTRVQLHPLTPLSHSLLTPHDPCPMLPWASSPPLKRKCRSWHGRCFGSSCWERSRLGYHHQQKQVTTCHMTCLKCCSDDRGNYLRKNVYHEVR